MHADADVAASGDAARRFAVVPLFAPLPAETVDAAFRRSVRRVTRRGDALFRQGEPADELVVLLRGAVAMRVVTAHGRIVTVGEWSAPAALDKVALLAGRPHSCSAFASETCEWRALRRAQFEELVDDVPALRRHVLRVLALQADASRRRFIDAATAPGTVRLARWLLERATADGELTSSHTQQELAQLLGVTRVTVSRALRRLREDGVVEVRGRTITLLAPEALARIGGTARGS